MPIQRIEVIDDYALGQLFIDWREILRNGPRISTLLSSRR